MIGDGYWSTGITVHWGYAGGQRWGWAAGLDFYDDGFCDPDATQGRLATRYFVVTLDDPLGRAIDLLKADAERLGIRFDGRDGEPPSLYYKGDGESPDFPPPVGWRALLVDQAERIGWRVPGGVPA
jgi:hypothetical protein